MFSRRNKLQIIQGRQVEEKVEFRVPTHQLYLNSLTFPDIFRSFSLTFPDLTARIWQVSQINPRQARKKFVPTNIRFYKNMSRNIKNLVYLGQIKIPWLSLTLDKKYWNSLTFPDFPEGNVFPDFPWCWEPWELSARPYFCVERGVRKGEIVWKCVHTKRGLNPSIP